MSHLHSGLKDLGGKAKTIKETILDSIWGAKQMQECMENMRIDLKDHPGIPVSRPLPLKEETVNIEGLKRFTFGVDSPKRNHTIMVLGSTGAGKSTLINGMVNYILGVKWEDPFRFVLDIEPACKSRSQAESQTSDVIAYKLNHQEGFQVDYSVTIIDTPGFGDTRGIERDRLISAQLNELFHNKQGVSEIDAVCFVAQASLARLTPTQRYVFDCVLSIFGKDIEENIRVLVTFADGQVPPVLEAIKVSGVPCPKTKKGLPLHFKFNNSALFAPKLSASHDDDDDDEDECDSSFDRMFWDMGINSMKRFFNALPLIPTKSLILTKEVLREREKLEVTVENLQKQVKLGMAKTEQMRKTHQIIEAHKAEVTANENFEYEVKIQKPVQVPHDQYNTNCAQCNTTCHYPCSRGNDEDKHKCSAMDSDGNCSQCPNKCPWNVHFNQKYNWEYEEVPEKLTVHELRDKYQSASQAKLSVEQLLSNLKHDYDQMQLTVLNLIDMSASCLARLKEIALNPIPFSTPEYIDLLIEGEKSECKPGYQDRIKALMEMRETAQTMVKVEKGDTFLPKRKISAATSLPTE